MTPTGTQALIIGLILTGTLVTCGFMKLLRSNKILTVLTLVALLIGIYGLLIRGEETEMPNGNGADFLAAPFVYVVSYALLRMLYKRVYKMEPTYERYSWYDAKEGRNQNWLDVTVYILPMLLSFVVPLMMGKLMFHS